MSVQNPASVSFSVTLVISLTNILNRGLVQNYLIFTIVSLGGT